MESTNSNSDNSNSEKKTLYLSLTRELSAQKDSYLLSLKEKFFSKLIFELPKFENNNNEIFQKYFFIIENILKKISFESVTTLLFKNNNFYISNNVNYWSLDNLENPKKGYFFYTYFSNFGSFKKPNYKISFVNDKNFIFFLNDVQYNNNIYSDVDFYYSFDSFDLGVLREMAASIYKNAILSKGILQIPNSEENRIISEEIISSIQTGVYVFDKTLVTSGQGAWDETSKASSEIIDNDLKNNQFLTSKNVEVLVNLFSKMENDFLKNKGIGSFEKNGTFNAHNAEIDQMEQEKNKLLIKKYKFFEKTINNILIFITSRTNEKLADGKFEFKNLEEILNPKHPKIEKVNNNIAKMVEN